MARKNTSPSSKKSKSRKVEDTDEDEHGISDDSLDDDRLLSSEAEEAPTRPSKRKRSTRSFIDVEAEVDEDDDEDDDDADYAELKDSFLADEEEEAEAAEMAPIAYQKLLRKTQKAAAADDEIDMAAEEERLRRLYGANTMARYAAPEDVPEQFLLPTAADPKLWLVRCRAGKEREVVAAYLSKAISWPSTSPPLQIHSVLYREQLRGYVYAEAHRQAHVVQALGDIHNVYSTRISLVPLAEMVNVLRYARPVADVKPGAWVRIRRGRYAGDAAQVIDVVDVGEVVRLRVVPRLAVYLPPHSAPGSRPPARLFNAQEVSQLDREHSISKSRGYWMYMNESFKNGFLEKDFKFVTIEFSNVKPSIDEISMFNEEASAKNTSSTDLSSSFADRDLGSASPELSMADTQPMKFAKGDSVLVTDGDLRGLEGVVTNVHESGVISIQPSAKSAASFSASTITCPCSHLKKNFKEGDLVTVMDGVHRGESGLIVKITDKLATLFSNISMNEYNVFINDLTQNDSIVLPVAMPTTSTYKSSSASASAAKVEISAASRFELFSFVQISGGAGFGVIYRITQSTGLIGVVDQHNVAQDFKASQLAAKPHLGRNLSRDANGATLAIGDLVEVLDGEHAKEQGTVNFINRSNVWLRIKTCIKNAGILALRASNLAVVGKGIASGHSSNGSSSAAPSVSENGAPMPPPKSDREIINKTVTITKGPYKGYLGIVKEITAGGLARVELHTNCQVITVERSKLHLQWTESASSYGDRSQDHRSGAASFKRPSTSASYSRNGPSDASTFSRAPGNFARDFADGGKTPNIAEGSKTPSWGGGKTPSWEGGKTPSWEGGKTPSWEGGKTPTWNGGFGGSDTAGPKTPSWQGANTSQSRAPSSNSNAATDNSWEVDEPYDTATVVASFKSSALDKSKQPLKQSASRSQSTSSPTPAVASGWLEADDWNGTSTQKFAAPQQPPTDENVGSGWFEDTEKASQTANISQTQQPQIAWGSSAGSNNRSGAPPAAASQSSKWIRAGMLVAPTAGVHAERRMVVQSVLHERGGDLLQCRMQIADAAASDEADAEDIFVAYDAVVPVRPSRKDAVCVLRGDSAAKTGTLISIDGAECIVKIEGSDEMAVVSLDDLVKIEK